VLTRSSFLCSDLEVVGAVLTELPGSTCYGCVANDSKKLGSSAPSSEVTFSHAGPAARSCLPRYVKG